MSNLEKMGCILETKNGDNFEYLLSENSYFVDIDYRVMQNSITEIFVPAMKICRNGKIVLFYLTENYIPINELRGIHPDSLLIVMANILSAVIKVQENGFLNCKNIVFNSDKIFVNVKTHEVMLVYVPISINEWETEQVFEENFRVEIVNIINLIVDETNKNLELFVKDICLRTLSIEDIYRRLCKCIEIPLEKENSSLMKLVSTETKGFEIVIESDSTVIGKKEELVDKVVPFNGAISRKHCRIIRDKERFYVIDENSANGTFVNNNRIMPGEKVPLSNGDTLRLANSDFIVM